jgi:hypothetical protein
MSAAATVLSFRYRSPKPICPVNVTASSAIRHAQGLADTGLARAESEMRSAGYSQDEAKHLARMVLLQFFDAFDGEDCQANDVFYGLRDRITRECWHRKIGTGLL